MLLRTLSIEARYFSYRISTWLELEDDAFNEPGRLKLAKVTFGKCDIPENFRQGIKSAGEKSGQYDGGGVRRVRP